MMRLTPVAARKQGMRRMRVYHKYWATESRQVRNYGLSPADHLREERQKILFELYDLDEVEAFACELESRIPDRLNEIEEPL